jgi:hypothetical protein
MVGSQRLVGGFHGVLVSSRDFILPPGSSLQVSGVLGDEVASGCLYLATKPSNVGG